MRMMIRLGGKHVTLLLLLCMFGATAVGQEVGSGTRNLQTIGRLSSDFDSGLGDYSVVVLDQSPDRPFAYLGGQSGWSIVNISDPRSPETLGMLETEGAVSSLAHFRVGARSFVAVAAGETVGVFDVSTVEGASPVLVGSCPGGATAALFAYRASSGHALLIVSSGDDAVLYDAADLIEGRVAATASIRTPELPDPAATGFESVYAAYHADTETDRLYGAGAGGYHVFDISDTDSVKYVTSATPAAVRRGHMVSATPDGRYLLAGAEYRAAPLRIFDLQDALEGKLAVVRTSLGAWTEDWTSFLVSHELRWPLVFVAAGERGLQVFNMRDPEGPYTYAYLRTSGAGQGAIDDRVEDVDGALDVDVRNADGLIAVVDRKTGLWLVRLEAFTGWDGRGYGLPNISSVQNWVHGPDGSTSF